MLIELHRKVVADESTDCCVICGNDFDLKSVYTITHGSDWQRWGRRGGLATLRRYGTSWYSALALKRWGRLDAEDLDRARVIGHGLPVKDD